MRKILLFALLALVSCAGERWNKPVSCLITGEITSLETSEVILLQAGQRPDWDGIPIPVVNGRFEYRLQTDTIRCYQLWIAYAPSAFYVCDFLPEDEGVRCICCRDSITMIPRGPMNRALARHRDESAEFRSHMAALAAQEQAAPEKFYAPEFVAAVMRYRQTEDKETLAALEKEIDRMQATGEHLSEQGRALQAAVRQAEEAEKAWERDYIAAHPSLPGFTLLTNRMRNEATLRTSDLPSWMALYDRVFADRFPGHPYHEAIELIRMSMKTRIGGHYIDAALPDVEGRTVRLSEAIGGKVALLDLWASWCGACRKRSKAMIPVYEKYKDAGFTVVGMAREFKNDKAWRTALEKDGYPWLNLLEMDDRHKLWEQYGIGNGGGASFLIDRDGTILAIDPTPEQAEAILKTKL